MAAAMPAAAPSAVSSSGKFRPAPQPVPGGTTRLPTPPRDRRPALAALALLLVVTGALASALVAYRTGSRTDVLVATHEIPIGRTITASDLAVARVAADSGAVVPASAKGNFVGTMATTRIPEGTLVNRLMFFKGGTVPDNAVVVGLVLSPQQRPAEDLKPLDVVGLYLVGKSDTGGQGALGQLLIPAVRVVAVAEQESGQSARVSVLVPTALAQLVVGPASGSQVAVVRRAASAAPPVDLRD